MGVFDEEEQRSPPRNAGGTRHQRVQGQRPQPFWCEAAQHCRLALPCEAQQVGQRREAHLVLGVSVVQQQQAT